MALTSTAKELLETLDSLTESERHEVFLEVLRRVALLAHESPTDEDLVAAANEVFLRLDRAENEE